MIRANELHSRENILYVAYDVGVHEFVERVGLMVKGFNQQPPFVIRVGLNLHRHDERLHGARNG